MLKLWIKNRALKVVSKPDGKRNTREFVEVGEWA